jgi:putative PIN family toxin of toxin-antitoxin system
VITAVLDLTEMIRLTIQRPEQSPLYRAWEARAFIWAVSEPLLDEFVQVSGRQKFARMIRPLVRDAVLNAMRRCCRVVTPAAMFPHCRDPKDDVVIATAVAAQARFIVTCDHDLLDDDLGIALADYNIRAVWPVEFVRVLQQIPAAQDGI